MQVLRWSFTLPYSSQSAPPAPNKGLEQGRSGKEKALGSPTSAHSCGAPPAAGTPSDLASRPVPSLASASPPTLCPTVLPVILYYWFRASRLHPSYYHQRTSLPQGIPSRCPTTSPSLSPGTIELNPYSAGNSRCAESHHQVGNPQVGSDSSSR